MFGFNSRLITAEERLVNWKLGQKKMFRIKHVRQRMEKYKSLIRDSRYGIKA